MKQFFFNISSRGTHRFTYRRAMATHSEAKELSLGATHETSGWKSAQRADHVWLVLTGTCGLFFHNIWDVILPID